jgi:hypothetical protein
MKNKIKIPFNPDDFNTSITVKELTEKFIYLLDLDYKKISLANEIISLNYEIISPNYKDFISSNIEDYFDFEVDAVI